MGRVVIEGRNPLDGTIINQLKLKDYGEYELLQV
jgi:hypothetical protein